MHASCVYIYQEVHVFAFSYKFHELAVLAPPAVKIKVLGRL